jgi:hypothetical protein
MGGMISAWRSMGQDPSVLKQKGQAGHCEAHYRLRPALYRPAYRVSSRCDR